MSTEKPRLTEEQSVTAKKLACQRWMPIAQDRLNGRNEEKILMVSPQNKLFEILSDGELKKFLVKDLTQWENQQYRMWLRL